MEGDQIKAAVKEQYGKVAEAKVTCGSLCGCTDNAEGWPSPSATPPMSWPPCPTGPISAFPAAIPRPSRRCGRAKRCSIWAAGPVSTASLRPARSGRPAGLSAWI